MKGIFNSFGIKVLDETTIKEAPFFCASNMKLFPLLLLPSIAKKISLFKLRVSKENSRLYFFSFDVIKCLLSSILMRSFDDYILIR